MSTHNVIDTKMILSDFLITQVRHSSSSLLGYLRSISDDVPALTRFTQYLLRIAKDNQKVDR